MVLAAFGADGKKQFRYAGGEAFHRAADFHRHQSSVGHGGAEAERETAIVVLSTVWVLLLFK